MCKKNINKKYIKIISVMVGVVLLLGISASVLALTGISNLEVKEVDLNLKENKIRWTWTNSGQNETYYNLIQLYGDNNSFIKYEFKSTGIIQYPYTYSDTRSLTIKITPCESSSDEEEFRECTPANNYLYCNCDFGHTVTDTQQLESEDPKDPEFISITESVPGQMDIAWRETETSGGYEYTEFKRDGSVVHTGNDPLQEYEGEWTDTDFTANTSHKYQMHSYYGLDLYQDSWTEWVSSDAVMSRIEDVTSVTCSNQTVSSMTVTVTSPLTNLGVNQSGVKLTDVSEPSADFMPTYQQSTSFNVGGLEAGTLYSFTFQTKNQAGVENSETDAITDASCVTLDDSTPDTTDPVVESLSATSPVCSGSNTTIAWSVSDSGGSGLVRVEIWKSTNGGSTWNEVGSCQTSVSGNSASGSCPDPVNQNAEYGIHVVDGKSNPVRVLKP